MAAPGDRPGAVDPRSWVAVGLVLVVAVVGWIAVTARTPLTSASTSDDGGYALQARLLADGETDAEYVLADADPDGVYAPLYPQGDAPYLSPYPNHPVYVRALQVATAVAGDPLGFKLLPLLGLLAGALASVALATVLSGAPHRGWVSAVALSSPLTIHAFQLWAHAWSYALAAAMTAVVVGLALRSWPRWWLPAVPGLAAVGAVLRSEAILFAGALGAAFVVDGLLRRRLSGVVAGVGAPLGAVVGLLVDRWVIDAEFGALPASENTRGSGALSGRIDGLFHTFVSMTGETAFVVWAALAAVVGFAVVAVRQWHRSPEDDAEIDEEALGRLLVGLGLAVLIGSVVAAIVLDRPFATGLVAGWPVVLLALLPRDRRLAGERALLGAVAIFAAAVAWTQYDEGGGQNWGGRFLVPALPILVVLVAAAIDDLTTRLRARDPGDGQAARLAAGGLVALLLAPPLASVIVDQRVRDANVRGIDVLLDRAPDRPVLTSVEHLPRLAWAAYPDVAFIAVKDAADAEGLGDVLRSAGVDEVVAYLLSADDAEAVFGRPFAEPVTEPTLLTVPDRT